VGPLKPGEIPQKQGRGLLKKTRVRVCLGKCPEKKKRGASNKKGGKKNPKGRAKFFEKRGKRTQKKKLSPLLWETPDFQVWEINGNGKTTRKKVNLLPPKKKFGLSRGLFPKPGELPPKCSQVFWLPFFGFKIRNKENIKD